MAIKLKPLDDYVVVKPVEEEEKSEGGIVLPDTAKEKPQKGEVLAAGPGKMLPNGDRRPLSVKAGDMVLFGKWGGSDVKIEGEELKILKENDILAKFG
jgi:chaperonin GroES